MRIGVLGGGAWGTVLSSLAAAHGHDVALWEFDAHEVARLSRDRSGARTVPGFRLPDAVTVTNDLPAAASARDVLVVVVPSDTVRATVAAAARQLAPGTVVVCASKGLEP